MFSKNYKTEGIIIKRVNYGEADRILTVFTKHYGKIKILAKGVRKINSRRGPNIELFNQVILFLHKGKFLDIISEVKLLNSFEKIRKDLKLINFAYQGAEVVDKLTREGRRQEEVYNLLCDYLNNIYYLSEGGLLEFKIKLLQILGFLPREDRGDFKEIDGYIENLIEKKLKARGIY